MKNIDPDDVWASIKTGGKTSEHYNEVVVGKVQCGVATISHPAGQ